MLLRLNFDEENNFRTASENIITTTLQMEGKGIYI